MLISFWHCGCAQKNFSWADVRMSLFSIIVPVYNAGEFLRPCLDSVLAQTDSDWECVCIDDGSTDGSGEILDSYARRDSRFRVVHQENQGVSSARNTGLEQASGAWITWLDADDLYGPQRLAEARRIISEKNPDLLRFRTYMGRAGESSFGCGARVSHDYAVFDGLKAKVWGWRNLMPAAMLWTWVARREILNGLKFRLGMRVKEDSIYCGNFVNRLNRVVQSEFNAYFYRYVTSSAMHSTRRADDCITLVTAVKELCQQERGVELETPDLASVMYSQLRTYAECDVLDWMRLRQGERFRNAEVRAMYRDLMSVGLSAYRSCLPQRFRLALAWWQKTGQDWPVICVMKAEKMARKFARLCRN